MPRSCQARGRPRHASEISLAACRRLDRASNVPLYYQLAATLLENLEAGGWRPGARFATERELEEEFGVSRAVVRRALELLVGDGAIHRVKGSGTFVAVKRRKTDVFGLVEALIAHRQDLTMTLLRACRESPDLAVARFLAVGRRTPVAHLTAVVKIAGQPVGLIDSRTAVSRVPWVLDAAREFERGEDPHIPRAVRLTRAQAIVEHTFFGSWGGPKLGVSAGDPALMTRLIQFGRINGEEAPLEFARLFHPSEATQLSFELVR